MISIAWIDMHIRDERVYEWLKELLQDGEERIITYNAVAQEFHCHPLTARAILKRLEGGGYIATLTRYRRGYSYRIVK